MSERLYVYGNWAAYDELSDGIELTEELAMTQLSHLLRLQACGVRFDAYLMDAFWYAPDGGYREWRRPHWPSGPSRWLEACWENGILPGMWFTANTLSKMTPVAAWADSVDSAGWGMCLFLGGFLADFASVLEFWYGQGVRVFKFDFADFGAVPARFGAVEDALSRNIEAFRGMLGAFRARCTEAVLMAYNGFEECECMERTDRAVSGFVSPSWLSVFDSMYCGDPRPSDLPDIDFWRSVDLYSDHMTRAFELSGIPLERIDNCGFMAGPTGTCYWRGKSGWQRMLLLSLARGGLYHVAYGDLSLFSDDDARWWAAAQRLYAGGGARFFGGLPGDGEPYGWAQPGVVTVVNPGSSERVVETPSGSVSLGAGRMAVLGSDLAFEESFFSSAVVSPVRSSGGEFAFPGVSAARGWVVVQQFDADGRLVRNWPGEEDWIMRARFSGASVVSFPERRVWSGMSWACFEVPSELLGTGFEVEVWGIGEYVFRAELRV